MNKVEVEVYNFKIGDKLRSTNFRGKPIIRHVRAIVDDICIITRVYSKRRGWVYTANDSYGLTLEIDSGKTILEPAKEMK